jgi:hypothetical protein
MTTEEGERASVTSGVRDNREVHSIVPERVVDSGCCFLLSARRGIEIRGEGYLEILKDVYKEFLGVMLY